MYVRVRAEDLGRPRGRFGILGKHLFGFQGLGFRVGPSKLGVQVAGFWLLVGSQVDPVGKAPSLRTAKILILIVAGGRFANPKP